MKHQILEHVRKVCGLKKLEFGSLLKIKMTDDEVVIKPIQWIDEATLGVIVECEEIEIDEIDACDYIEIIGLPVHLEHLLFAIGETEYCMSTGIRFYPDGMHIFYDDGENSSAVAYDLTKSVEQNLEDPQVCEVISKLLKLK